jgi:uncharacterized protein
MPHSGAIDLTIWEKALEDEYLRREEERRQVLSRAIPKLTEYFRDKRVTAVYLTGSVLQGGRFYPFSDVDIAVEGLQENYFAVLVQLEDLVDRQVDLMELERCRFGHFIRERGRRIL